MEKAVLWTLGICFLGSIISKLWIYYVKFRFKSVHVMCTDRGEIVAKNIIKNNGFYNECDVVDTEDYSVEDLKLSDCFLIQSNKIVLTKEVFYETTIWSTAVAAHEASHAVQFNTGNHSRMMSTNSFAGLSGIFFISSMVCGLLALATWSSLVLASMLILLILVLVCQLVTFGIEKNASKLAITFLKETGLYTHKEISSMKHTLNAAAFTYFSALFTTVITIFVLLGSLTHKEDV